MGTSKGYRAPSGPQWTPLKRQVTSAARNRDYSRADASKIVQAYVAALGGASAITGRSRAVSSVGRNLGRFMSLVSSVGLDQALVQEGLSSLIGKSAFEVGFSILDRIASESSTLDDIDARKALDNLMEEILEGAESYDEVKNRLEQQITKEQLENWLVKFLAYYIFEGFCRAFYERLLGRVGQDSTDPFLKMIRDCILADLANLNSHRPLVDVDWSGEEGLRVINEVFDDTVQVFGGGIQ